MRLILGVISMLIWGPGLLVTLALSYIIRWISPPEPPHHEGGLIWYGLSTMFFSCLFYFGLFALFCYLASR